MRETSAQGARPIRVLLVSGLPFVRGYVSRALEATGLMVVTTAQTGAEALAAVRRSAADVVVVDVDGPAAWAPTLVARLMEDSPRPVVLLGGANPRASASVLDALAAGAVDFVLVPDRPAGLSRPFVEELGRKVMGCAGLSARALANLASLARARNLPAPPSGRRSGPVPAEAASFWGAAVREPARRVAAVAASTGGPQTLETLLSRLPGSLPAAVLVTQHMPVGFTAALARRLNERSGLHVIEAFEGAPLEEGLVYLAPGGFHLTVDDNRRLHLDDGPPVHHVRPAADVMMASVARRFGPDALAVVLTGMGADGTEGARLIKEAGGQCFVQEEASCVVAGMPRSAIRAGLADEIRSPEELAEAIARWAFQNRPASPGLPAFERGE